MFKGQHKGLYALALANTGERFGYYTMLAIFMLFLQAKFGWNGATASQVYAIFLAAVYFMPVVGGWLADKIGYGKCVVTGIAVMFTGYLCLSIPTAANTLGVALMIGALTLIAIGTGLFKGNLQVLVGNLYDDPKYSAKRDSAFSLFYMAINIGAMFAPAAATAITNRFLGKAGLIYKADIPALAHQFLDGSIAPEKVSQLEELMGQMPGIGTMDTASFCQYYIDHLSSAYNMGFAVACLSLIVSVAIYFGCKKWFKHADVNAKQAAAGAAPVKELTKQQERSRVIALILVFAVVIFFWMAFHQNGLSLTYFADEFTAQSAEGLQAMCFNVWNLVAVIFIVYAGFSLFQSKTTKGKAISGAIIVAALAFLFLQYDPNGGVTVSAPIFQQFNPFYVVALTPVSMAIFGSLAAKGKEPSAPRKIAYGMIVAAIAYALMAFGSFGLPMPQTEMGADGNPVAVHVADVTPNLLIMVYLVLTFGELLLSPMGISFVSKVAPPKYKGMMMGGWFVATAIGNQLVVVGGLLWGAVPLWVCWSVFLGVCLVAALFMFAMMKRLEKVC